MKLLHESMGHVVTIELCTGETLRGRLHEAEDCFNMLMTDVTHTSRVNNVTHMEKVYVRGSSVKLVIVPNMLKNAPMFQKKQQLGVGKGRTALSRKSRYSRPLYGT